MKTKPYKIRIELEQAATSPRQALVYMVDYIHENQGDIVGLVTDPKGVKWLADLSVDGPALKMKLDQMKPEDYFDSVELVTFMEMAQLGLEDSSYRGCFRDDLDLSDEELDRLQRKLTKFLNP